MEEFVENFYSVAGVVEDEGSVKKCVNKFK